MHIQMQEQPHKICLKPDCPQLKNRLFTPEQIVRHGGCSNWCCTISQIFDQINPAKIDLSQPIKISFNHSPILQLKYLISLSKWPEKVQQIFKQLKKNIVFTIDQMKDSTIRQFKLFSTQAKKGLQSVKKYITAQNKKQSTLSPFWKVLQTQSITLFQSQNLTTMYTKKILPTLNRMRSMIQSFDSKEQASSLMQLKFKFSEKTKEFFQTSQISINQKIQRLTNAFNCEMVKAIYDDKQANYRAQCFLCQKIVYSTKDQSNRRLGALQNLLEHVRLEHYSQVYTGYMGKILRFQVCQLEVGDFLEQVFLSKPKSVWIIDRENAGLIEKPVQWNDENLWVEVVNENNKNLAKGRFIAAGSRKKDAADILISMIVYGILSQSESSVYLVTKDHFGKVLEQINQKLYGKRMECLEPGLAARMIAFPQEYQ